MNAGITGCLNYCSLTVSNPPINAPQDEIVGGRRVWAALEERSHVVPVQAWEDQYLGSRLIDVNVIVTTLLIRNNSGYSKE